MKISVALCTYNGEKYLSDQLASYLKQERLPDELIICDDRSTDGTIKVLERFSTEASFPVRLYINENNLGSTKNFEKAFQLCEGDIIAPSDQDDVWHPSKLRKIETAFNENQQAGLVFTDGNVVDTNLAPLGYTLWQSIKFIPSKQNALRKGNALSVLMKHNVVTGAAMAFRRNLMSVFTPIPSIWVHDAWITFILAMVTDILPISEPLIEYRQHSNNQVGTPSTTYIARIGYALAQDKALQKQIYERYLVLEKYLEDHFPEKTDILQQIREQIIHRKIRSEIPTNRLRRIPIILRELMTGRYHHYSFGYSSAAKDFLV